MTDVQQRFMSKVIVRPRTRCWIWIGAKSYGISGKAADPYGYFLFEKKNRLAHRVSYQLHVGPIPEGKQIDHLCRHTLCVNPDHLEPVTPRENVRRGYSFKPKATHCANGHEMTAENTYLKPQSTTVKARRECRTCRAIQIKAHYARKEAAHG